MGGDTGGGGDESTLTHSRQEILDSRKEMSQVFVTYL